MAHLTKEQIAAALDNPKEISPELKKKLEELEKKMKATTSEKRAEARRKMDEERW